jgi:hypothetical protein
MPYYYETRTPNQLFDFFLPKLSESELKVLLIIIRQTLGWMDPVSKKPKEWDWISNAFFVKKTGLSKRSVGIAIASLIDKKIIQVKNECNAIAHNPVIRRRAFKLFYRTTFGKQAIQQL